MFDQDRLTYDAESDALYIRFAVLPVRRTVRKGDLRMLDYAEDGVVAGIEFLQASGGLELSDLSQRQEIEGLLSERGLHFPIFA